MTENLMEGLLREMNRCRELIMAYESIGPAGAFGRAMIKQDIANAEKAIGSGDVVAMVGAFKALQACE